MNAAAIGGDGMFARYWPVTSLGTSIPARTERRRWRSLGPRIGLISSLGRLEGHHGLIVGRSGMAGVLFEHGQAVMGLEEVRVGLDRLLDNGGGRRRSRLRPGRSCRFARLECPAGASSLLSARARAPGPARPDAGARSPSCRSFPTRLFPADRLARAGRPRFRRGRRQACRSRSDPARSGFATLSPAASPAFAGIPPEPLRSWLVRSDWYRLVV